MNEPDLRHRTLDFLRKYGLEPKESFSQNFLIDEAAVEKIVSDIPFGDIEEIVEIGPGLGALTFPLIKKGKHVTAIELDRDMAAVLISEIKDGNFRLIQGDFLKTDMSMFHVKPTAFVGNLPYSISRSLISKVASDSYFRYFGFMVQKDLAAKLFYKQGSSQNNPYSVFLALRGRLSLVCELNPGSFMPPPHVGSAYLSLLPYKDSLCSPEVFRFVSVLFADPKKNLGNNLRRSEWSALLAELPRMRIDPSLRSHQLSLDNFRSLIKAADLR